MDPKEILVCYGQSPAQMARRLAEEANLAGMIGDRNKSIGIKPNLVVARPAEEGATTHVEIAEGVIAYLQEQGFGNITLLEGAWVGDSTQRAFSVCGYRALAQKTGVPLVDTQADTAPG